MKKKGYIFAIDVWQMFITMIMIGMVLFSMTISAQTSWQSINRYAQGLTERNFVLALGLNESSWLKSINTNAIGVTKVATADEDNTSILVDFEEGEISPFYWQHIGVPWHISDSVTLEGNFSLRSGNIAESISAIAVTITASGSPLYFDLALAMGNSQDKLYFYIDEELRGEWTNQHLDLQLGYALSPGKHKLKWEYRINAWQGMVPPNEPTPTPVLRALIDNIMLPAIVDSDGDGVDDSWEYLYFDSLNVDLSADFDNDGLSLWQEFLINTNPNKFDTDEDGMSDGWEYDNGLDPLVNDASGDIDNDGTSNIIDYIIATPNYPEDSDLDGDGISDLFEAHNGMNPVWFPDAGDDDDNDGLPNDFERFHGLDPHYPADVVIDTDQDGFNIWQEFFARTNDSDPQVLPFGTYLGFEDNSFDDFYWLKHSPTDWFVDHYTGYQGEYALRTSLLSGGQASVLEVIINATGENLYFEMLDTEAEGWYLLYLYVDGIQQGMWIGGQNIFQHVEVPLSAGQHRLKWFYQNYSQGENNDNMAWLDNLYIPALADSDYDGFKDGWEYLYFDDLTQDMVNDTDGDMLSHAQEYVLETNPTLFDTDGDGVGDGEEVEQGSDPLDPLSFSPVVTIYEDAEDDNTWGWWVYDNTPDGASISNVFDLLSGSNVIEFNGSGVSNGYQLRHANNDSWANTQQFILQWDMRYQANYTVYVSIDTLQGHRYLYYNGGDTHLLATDDGYIHHGLGNESYDNVWHTFSRDLRDDLADAEPDNQILAVNSFLIRGNGRVDNIQLGYVESRTVDSDNDGITNVLERDVYGTDPLIKDTDGDGLDDGSEASYWGVDYQNDADNDGIINILDKDSDNDGLNDYLEILYGSDPADASDTSYPPATSYETGEENTAWQVYDNNPSGGSVTSVYDDLKQDNVIELAGNGLTNGFRLRTVNNQDWNNNTQFIIQWSMRYSESYMILVSVDTLDGHRYLYYTEEDSDLLSTYNNYIHHGLGSESTDDKWHTFARDLQADLAAVEPTNQVVDVNGLFVRGSGRLDDVSLASIMPDTIDSDNDGLTNQQELAVYGTDQYKSDTDDDGLTDNEELNYWGANWDLDVDNDGIVNLLDADSDNDGQLDGVEVLYGSDPADANSLPAMPDTVYADGEDGSITTWQYYGNATNNADINIVYDSAIASNVIEINTDATSNGYRLYADNMQNWDNGAQLAIEWDFRYNESYVIYISVDTAQGHRYLYYSASNSDGLGTAPGYIHHGLGTQTLDNNWHSISRDLAADLAEVEPDNTIIDVNGFLIRGSGRVDNIKLSTID